MGYCVAPNRKSLSSKGTRLFRFPADKNCRAIWLQNCRRDKWQPTEHSQLCELHFEDSQFEQNRADGRKLLKRNAVPTIFDVPNPPKLLKCKRKPPKKREPPVMGAIDLACFPESQGTDDSPSMDADSEDATESLRSENKKLKREVKHLKEKLQKMEKRLSCFLMPDKIQYLKQIGSTNPYTWSNQTIRNSLQLKCAVGNKGYEFLRSIEYPLPSLRTLIRRIESCSFAEGIQHDIIHWLGIKLHSSDEQGKLCVLSLDEMQLRPYMEYDKCLKKYVGIVNDTFVNSSEPQVATHALVFVVRGLTLHWKQVVAYVLTGNSTNGKNLWNIVKQLIISLHSNGLFVKCVTSDMGASNIGMWGAIGIHSIRNHVNCKIPHPGKPSENLYFVADVPNILKNIRNCLLTQNITLPADLVEQKLKYDIVSLKHVASLVELQEVGGPVLVPNLN